MIFPYPGDEKTCGEIMWEEVKMEDQEYRGILQQKHDIKMKRAFFELWYGAFGGNGG